MPSPMYGFGHQGMERLSSLEILQRFGTYYVFCYIVFHFMVVCVTFSYEPLILPRCVVGPVGLAFYNSFRSARASFSEVSFLPYLFHEVYHTHMAKLYVSGADGVLNVWIDPREVRRAESCHDKKVAKSLWRMIGLLSLKLFCVSKVLF